MPPRETPQGVLGVTRRPTRREWRRALTLFAAGIVGLVVVLLVVHPQANLLPVGSAAPTFTLTASDGTSVTPSSASASPVYILEFFEAGCQHCQDVAGQLCGEKVPVFAVDTAKEDASTLTAFHRRYAPGCRYPLLLDPNLTVSGKFAVTAVPTVYLVSGGRIAYAGAGLDGVAGLTAAVAKATGG